MTQITLFLKQVGEVDRKLRENYDVLNVIVPREDSVNHVHGFDKMRLDCDYVFITGVNEVAVVFFLVAHFNIDINSL